MDTEWRPIKEYEGFYEVSNKGDVRNSRTGRVLKPATGRGGHRNVSLWRDGKGSGHEIGPMVLEAFVESRPEGMVARHGSKGNSVDEVDNLCWGTQSVNLGADRLRDGTNGRKLNADDVREIRRLKAVGITYSELEQKFPVNRSTLWGIVQGFYWAEVH